MDVIKHKIRDKIHTLRGVQVILDTELAALYDVSTKALNQAVRRNSERFPKNFTFQLNADEKNELVTNCDHLQSLKYSYQLPYAFTEQGVAMLSGVLKSKTAIKTSIDIINAFVNMRKFIATNADMFRRLDNVEKKQLEYDGNLNKIFKELEKNTIPEKGIFFDGQVFDAYKFVSDLIKSANESIILIDNYIDESVLTLLSNKKENVTITIYTANISEKLRLATNKFNQQYKSLELVEFTRSHDRFLIIDKETYHIGASLKDLGKKWFAFSKFNYPHLLEMLAKS